MHKAMSTKHIGTSSGTSSCDAIHYYNGCLFLAAWLYFTDLVSFWPIFFPTTSHICCYVSRIRSVIIIILRWKDPTAKKKKKERERFVHLHVNVTQPHSASYLMLAYLLLSFTILYRHLSSSGSVTIFLCSEQIQRQIGMEFVHLQINVTRLHPVSRPLLVHLSPNLTSFCLYIRHSCIFVTAPYREQI